MPRECPYCGAKLLEDGAHCPSCGAGPGDAQGGEEVLQAHVIEESGTEFVTAETLSSSAGVAKRHMRNRKRAVIAIIACVLVVAAVGIGVNVMRYVEDTSQRPVVFEVEAKGYDSAQATPIPLKVTGTTARQQAVDEVFYVDASGNGVSLCRGSYKASVVASPIGADGETWHVADQVFSIEIGSEVGMGQSVYAGSAQSIVMSPADASELDDAQITLIEEAAAGSSTTIDVAAAASKAKTAMEASQCTEFAAMQTYAGELYGAAIEAEDGLEAITGVHGVTQLPVMTTSFLAHDGSLYYLEREDAGETAGADASSEASAGSASGSGTSSNSNSSSGSGAASELDSQSTFGADSQADALFDAIGGIGGALADSLGSSQTSDDAGATAAELHRASLTGGEDEVIAANALSSADPVYANGCIYYEPYGAGTSMLLKLSLETLEAKPVISSNIVYTQLLAWGVVGESLVSVCETPDGDAIVVSDLDGGNSNVAKTLPSQDAAKSTYRVAAGHVLSLVNSKDSTFEITAYDLNGGTAWSKELTGAAALEGSRAQGSTLYFLSTSKSACYALDCETWGIVETQTTLSASAELQKVLYEDDGTVYVCVNVTVGGIPSALEILQKGISGTDGGSGDDSASSTGAGATSNGSSSAQAGGIQAPAVTQDTSIVGVELATGKACVLQ